MPNTKTPKQLAKKFKKLKNTIMASIRAKIDWKRPRKSESKKLSLHFVPTRTVIENFIKIAEKLKKYHCGLISSQNRTVKDEKDRK